jgi:hypothetical protein
MVASWSWTMNFEQFVKNRNAFPADELARYVGQHVAWSPDGTRILASDEDPLKVFAAVRAAGYDTRETMIEAVSSPDEISLGGALLFVSDEEAAT